VPIRLKAKQQGETEKMYANNVIARRRPEGWAERRRYFKRLLLKAQPAEEKSKEKLAPTK
jgi:hypothetical protein